MASFTAVCSRVCSMFFRMWPVLLAKTSSETPTSSAIYAHRFDLEPRYCGGKVASTRPGPFQRLVCANPASFRRTLWWVGRFFPPQPAWAQPLKEDAATEIFDTIKQPNKRLFLILCAGGRSSSPTGTALQLSAVLVQFYDRYWRPPVPPSCEPADLQRQCSSQTKDKMHA